MAIAEIIAGIDAQIASLESARDLLKGGEGKVVAFASHKKTAKRTISAAGRARIAAAQRARWAKTKKAAKKVARKKAVKKAAKEVAAAA